MQNNRIFFSPLGQTFCISYREKLEYFLNSSEFATSQRSKILLVLKRFRVENFVYIRPVEMFVFNFSKYWVFTCTVARTCHTHLSHAEVRELVRNQTRNGNTIIKDAVFKIQAQK
jgi:hypothetical protein